MIFIKGITIRRSDYGALRAILVNTFYDLWNEDMSFTVSEVDIRDT
jgi:hypothetical protein